MIWRSFELFSQQYQQPYYTDKCFSDGNLVNSESICQEILSIPFHPFISQLEMDKVAKVINEVGHN